MLELVTDRQIYQEVICRRIPHAQKYLWIATADIKDLYVDKNSKKVPFLEILSDLVAEHVEIRLLHAKEPGPAFRQDFDRYPNLIEGIERILCPRIHLKTIVIDGTFAYTGSANLTGAGLGAKNENKRNFENGIVTTDQKLIIDLMEQFDRIWSGNHCPPCQRKKYCADYQDLIAEK